MSGHSVFQYGDYPDCIDTQGFNYNLVEFGISGADTGIFLGMCLPQICTADIIRLALDGLLKKDQLPFQVYGVKSHIQYYQFAFTPLFFVTIVVMMSLVSLVLIATLSNKKGLKYLKCFALQETLKVLNRRELSLIHI